MTVKVKILRTHKRAEDCRTVHSYVKNEIISVSQEYAAQIVKDKDGELIGEEVVTAEVVQELPKIEDEIKVDETATIAAEKEAEIVETPEEKEQEKVEVTAEVVEKKEAQPKFNNKFKNKK